MKESGYASNPPQSTSSLINLRTTTHDVPIKVLLLSVTYSQVTICIE
jgi:hypothetical protein